MEKIKIYDRTDILDILIKRLHGLVEGYRQNISIIGNELLGKSTILKYFTYRIDNPKILPIYLELDKITFDLFVNKYIGILLYNYLRRFENIELSDDLNYLIEKARLLIPKTTERVLHVISNNKNRKRTESFISLIDLPETFFKETQISTLVVFDEFQEIENFQIKYIYKIWAKIMMLQKHTMYIISSSQPMRAQKILKESLTLLFGNFEALNIKPFSAKVAKEFITSRLYPYIFNEIYLKFLIHFTGAVPFYLELFCQELINKIKEKDVNEISKETLIEAINHLIIDEWGMLSQRYMNILNNLKKYTKNKKELSVILLTLSSGINKVKDVACELKMTKNYLLERLNKLQELDLVEKNGDFYFISDKVFNFWVDTVYRNYLSILDIKTRHDKFRQMLNSSIEEFTRDSGLDIVDRIRSIFTHFSNDTIQIQTKRIRLNKFREVRPIEFNSGILKKGIIARGLNSLWLLTIKHDSIKEDDIDEFTAISKKFQANNPIRIILTFDQVETNAKIKA